MPDRAAAWLRQSEHDLVHARYALDGGMHDWACLAAAGAADKAIKAALVLRGGPVLGGQNLLMLLARFREEGGSVPDGLFDDARELMEDIAITVGQSCFNGIAPFELMSRAQAEGAIAAADRLRRHMADFCHGTPTLSE
ncbi:HEPN domain-containing protein [Azospirillum sp. sgz302134]